MDFSAPYSLRLCSWLVLVRVTKEAKPFLGVRIGVLVQWRVVDTRGWTGNLAVVGWRVQVDNMESIFQEVYTRDEGFSLDAVFVEVIWVTVGGCNQNNSMRHKSFEEPNLFVML